MKITSARGVRRAEVTQRKSEYDAQEHEYDFARSLAAQAREADIDAIIEPVKAQLTQDLSIFDSVPLNISVRYEPRYSSDYTEGKGGLKVSIQSDDRSENNALRWEYTVELDFDGNVVASTGSWSGLNATTPSQLLSLRQTVSILEYLSDVDWPEMLDKQLPRSNYYENVPKKPQYVDWTSQYHIADMEDLVGDKSTAILVKNWESSDYYGRDLYIRILRDAGSQYVVNVIPERYKQLCDSGDFDRIPDYVFQDTRRIRKTTTHPVYDSEGNPQYWELPEKFANL